MPQQPTETKLVFNVAQNTLSGIDRYAQQHNMERQEAAEALIRLGLMTFYSEEESDKDAVMRQIRAEIAVMNHVEATVEALRVSGWDERVINTVFEHIRNEQLDEYRTAIGGEPFAPGNPEKARINRRIGKRIRRLLGANVVIDGKGQPAKAYPSAAEQSLIRSFTLLCPGWERDGGEVLKAAE